MYVQFLMLNINNHYMSMGINHGLRRPWYKWYDIHFIVISLS